MLLASLGKGGRGLGAVALVLGAFPGAASASWIVTQHSVTPGYAAYDRDSCVKFFGQGSADAKLDASPRELCGSGYSFAFLNCSASAAVANQAQESWTYVVDPSAGQVVGEVEVDARVRASVGVRVEDPPGSGSAHSMAAIESNVLSLEWDLSTTHASGGTDVGVGVSTKGLSATVFGGGGGPGIQKKGDVQQSGGACPLDAFMLETRVFGCLTIESHTNLFNPYSEANSWATGLVECSLRLLCHSSCP